MSSASATSRHYYNLYFCSRYPINTLLKMKFMNPSAKLMLREALVASHLPLDLVRFGWTIKVPLSLRTYMEGNSHFYYIRSIGCSSLGLLVRIDRFKVVTAETSEHYASHEDSITHFWNKKSGTIRYIGLVHMLTFHQELNMKATLYWKGHELKLPTYCDVWCFDTVINQQWEKMSDVPVN